MSKLSEALRDLFDKIKDSEAYLQLKAKYDELDSQTKIYVQLGSVASVCLIILSTVFYGVAKLNAIKADINAKEELIGYLQQSADAIKQLKMQSMSQNPNADTTTPLPGFIDSIVQNSGLDASKVNVSSERNGTEDKESREVLVDIKLNQINLRQLVRLMFTLTDQGKARKLNIKDLIIDTKGDPNGYLEAIITVANFRAK